MRVGVVVEKTSHYCDSAGVAHLEHIAATLAERGHDVELFCTGWWDGYDTTRMVDGVKYRAVTISPARASFVARLPAVLARFRPDVVHSAAAPPPAVRAAGIGARLAHAPLVVSWYSDEAVDSRLGPAVRTPDRIVTPSRLVQKGVRERGVPEAVTQVIPESIDMDLVRGTHPCEGADVVYARRLDEHANLESLLLALAELRRREWTAAVVGEGPMREEYEREAAHLRIDDRVEFLGERPREELVARYRGAHVFVHTAGRTCFATELLWALACGCVGVVEYQEGSSAHELVEGHPRGLRVTSPEVVKDALIRAADLDKHTVDESFAEFDHDTVIERYVDCYEQAGAQ